MSKIFISHSSSDNAKALAVSQWLEQNGWGEYFLDIMPSRGLSPGERWQQALKTATDRCEAVLFLISPAWRDSKWCLAEFLLAKQLGKTIFGVIVESTSLDSLPREMTTEWQLCDLVTGTGRLSFHVHRDQIVPPTDIRGLDTLRRMDDRGEHLFVILGASGSGKSSFMRAGLWPRLKRDDRHFLPLPVIRPERAAISRKSGLLASFETAFTAYKQPKTRAQLRTALEQPLRILGLVTELQLLAKKALGRQAEPPTVMFAIDQGEE